MTKYLPTTITLLILICLGYYAASEEYFTAMVDMGKALQVGKEIATDLNTYLDLEEARIKRLRQFAEKLEPELPDGQLTDFEEYLFNPINAYLTIRRLGIDWRSELLGLMNGTGSKVDHLQDHLDTKDIEDARSRVVQHANMLPGDNDVTGAADALLRLQATYKLSAEKIADGHLTDEISCPRLSAAQCMHLGTNAYSHGDFAQAEDWFRAAYNKVVEATSLKAETEEVQPTLAEVLDYLAYSIGRQGRYHEALNVTRMLIQEDPDNQRAIANEEFYRDRLKAGDDGTDPNPQIKTLTKFEEETIMYEALCRGENPFPQPSTKLLYCRYYIPHPYYLIGPVKEEILFPDPKIVMWYDLIHPGEVEQLKELAIPRLRRATIKNPVTGKLEYALYRISKSAWLPYGLDEITHRMSQRIAMVTGLNLETAEDLQVGNYGLGGYYAPHFDFGRKREKDAFEVRNGNRIATIIFYLTDVQAGGATVFNRIGARVEPIRGAAGFWYNMLPSGEGNLLTRHAACPVLVGSKWVMNVWFHERGQEFIRPCELERGPIEADDGF